MEQEMQRELQLHDNPPVMFSRGDETHTGWRLRLTAPANRQARINTPDSAGWSLDVDTGRQSATIGCNTERAYADVLWIGPENLNAFHTTLRGILGSCGGGNRGQGTPPWFRLDIVDGLVAISPTRAQTLRNQSVLFEAFTRRGEVSGAADREPAVVTWGSEDTVLIFSAEENGPALEEGQRTRSSIWVRSATIGSFSVTAAPANEEQEPLHATLQVAGVENITVTPGNWPASTELPEEIHIAAGGIHSPAHQATVQIKFYPPLPDIPAAVMLQDGVGHDRSAELSILQNIMQDGHGSFIYFSDTNGLLTGVLTSGDTLGTLEIHADDKIAMVRQTWMDPYDMQEEWDVRFEDRDGVLTDYAFINGGGKMHYRVRFPHRRIPGDPNSPLAPMDQHEIRFFVEEVVYMDTEGYPQTITNTPSAPDERVNEWASFEQTVFTDSDGWASAVMNVADRASLVSVTVIPYDYTVWVNADAAATPAGPVAMGAMQAAAPANETQELDNRVKHPLYRVPKILAANYAVVARASMQIPLTATAFESSTSEIRHDMIVFLGSTELNDWAVKFFDSNGQEINDDSVQVKKNTENPAPHPQLFQTNLQTPGQNLNRFASFRIDSRREENFTVRLYHKNELFVHGSVVPVTIKGEFEGESGSVPLVRNNDNIFWIVPLKRIADASNFFEFTLKLSLGEHSPQVSFGFHDHQNFGAFGDKFQHNMIDPRTVRITTTSETESTTSIKYGFIGNWVSHKVRRDLRIENNRVTSYAFGITKNEGTELKTGSLPNVTLVAADVGIAKPTGQLPPTGEWSTQNLAQHPVFLFDAQNSAGKCIAVCETTALAGLSPATQTIVWEMLEWVLPNVGALVPGDGVPSGDGRIQTFTYNGMPANNNDFGNKEITLRFKNRNVWAYKRDVQFRYNRTGNGAAALHHANMAHVNANDPNWYVYWQQVAVPFGFGPHTAMIYSGPSPDGVTGGEYRADVRINIWDEKILLYDNLKDSIVSMLKIIHHENAHRVSYQQPHANGGWGNDLIWNRALDEDRDLVNDQWEAAGQIGNHYGFSVVNNLAPEERHDRDVLRKLAWDHGWHDLENAEQNGIDVKAINPGPFGGNHPQHMGLCPRYEALVDGRSADIILNDWSLQP